jgi:hypothetical protein
MLAEGGGKVIEKSSTFNGKYVRISTEGSPKSMMASFFRSGVPE